jgi:hypothetical protein
MLNPHSSGAGISLNIVSANAGVAWVKQGIKTFFKQPLALGGLFFMNFGLSQLLAMLPLVGVFIAIVLIPAFNLGLLTATRIANEGTFPMPKTLFEAFRFGSEKIKAIVQLGVMYMAGILIVVSVFLLLFTFQPDALGSKDPATIAKNMMSGDFFMALAVSFLAYIPLGVAFWHAPALVFWHGVKPIKALFFSAIACYRNLSAMLVYFLSWLGVFLVGGLVLSVVAGISGSESAVSFLMLPVALMLAAMFFNSIYFTYVDSFKINKIKEDTVAIQ